MAAHPPASILTVFTSSVFARTCFASSIKQMPPAMFSDTAITDCHYDTTIFQLRAHWVLISWGVFDLPESESGFETMILIHHLI